MSWLTYGVKPELIMTCVQLFMAMLGAIACSLVMAYLFRKKPTEQTSEVRELPKIRQCKNPKCRNWISGYGCPLCYLESSPDEYIIKPRKPTPRRRGSS